jgi:hypothetical protein
MKSELTAFLLVEERFRERYFQDLPMLHLENAICRVFLPFAFTLV